MMVYAQIKANLETAMLAVSSALASGKATVSYTIDGDTHTVVPSNELLKSLREEYDIACRRTSRSGRFRLAAPRRPTTTGSA